jgi:hypothetical protein
MCRMTNATHCVCRKTNATMLACYFLHPIGTKAQVILPEKKKKLLLVCCRNEEMKFNLQDLLLVMNCSLLNRKMTSLMPMILTN